MDAGKQLIVDTAILNIGWGANARLGGIATAAVSAANLKAGAAALALHLL
jgi:enolase